MHMCIADWSDVAWLQSFNEVGNVIFEMSANELHNIKVSIPRLKLITKLSCSIRCKMRTNIMTLFTKRLVIFLTFHVVSEGIRLVFVQIFLSIHRCSYL